LRARPLSALVITFLALAALPPARASADAPIESAYQRPVAFGAYSIAWAGAYAAIGGGARARWEMVPELGVEVFAEALAVEHTGGVRHDHPIGFDLFVPITLTPWLRLRPLFGFCAVFSLVEPQEAHAPRADDILFGVHGGGGIELAVGTWVSFFLDLQANLWIGHDRAAQGWTGGIEDTYVPFGSGQIALGAQLHLGD
jgi:hypothetical protein